MSAFHFSFGPQWHALWPHRTIERNRRIYDFELVYFASGTARFITEKASFRCTPGSVLIVPPDLPHCTASDGACERWCIHFDWFGDCGAHRGEKPRIFVFADEQEEFDRSAIASTPELPEIVFPFFRSRPDGEILPLLRRCFIADSSTFSGMLQKDGLLREILALAFAGISEPMPSTELPPLFVAAKNFIDTNFRNGALHAGVVADEMHVTVNYLSKLFRRGIGLSVGNYILTQRLEFTRKLLEESTLSIREIAFACGFEDANYFSRLFRKHVGFSPGELRRRATASVEPDSFPPEPQQGGRRKKAETDFF